MRSAPNRAGPEHRLQVAIVKWCRAQIIEPHVLLCFDRSRPHGERTHLYEAQRGIVAGTPDAALLLSGPRQVVWLEFKAGKGRQSENQKTMQARLEAIGQAYLLIYSVSELMERLGDKACVRLAGTAAWAAADADARLGAAAAPVRKPRAPRPEVSGEERARASRERLQGWLDEG